jgi:hypothetical protein
VKKNVDKKKRLQVESCRRGGGLAVCDSAVGNMSSDRAMSETGDILNTERRGGILKTERRGEGKKRIK